MLPQKSWSPRPIFEQKRVKLKKPLPTPMEVFLYNKSIFLVEVVDIYGFIGDHMPNLSNFCPFGGILLPI